MSSNKQMTLSEVEAMVSRLSKTKEPKEKKTESQKKPILTNVEADELFERLAKHKKIASPKVLRKNNGSELSSEETEKLFERLSKSKPSPPLPPVDRGDVESQMQIDKLVDRLSIAKKPLEYSGEKSRKKSLQLSKSAVHELVARLSNKEVALKQTPDTKRVMNGKYGIVSSYAWNGYNYQAILCNEESP